MRYSEKIVVLPPDMVVGSKVGVSGEGDEVFTIEEIVRNMKGNVADIVLSCCWREPLCKIHLLRGENFSESIIDETCFVRVEIGECDVCGNKFPDSCVYHTGSSPESMVCPECCKKEKTKEI